MTDTYPQFVEHLRTDSLEGLPKPALLEVYRNLDRFAQRVRQETDWPMLTQLHGINGKRGESARELPALDSALSTREVNLGLSYLETFHRADRCLECFGMPCSTGKLQFTEETLGGCPVLIDIPAFIKLVKEGKIFEAWLKLMESDSLPAITGRVCPQEDQCQLSCSLTIKDEPVEIGRLERFVADYVWENHPEAVIEHVEALRDRNANSGNARHHIAVIGSGPAGLTVAIDLAVLGYHVTIFEALHVPGGVLAYGIPVFRLPARVLQRELGIAHTLGIRFVHNVTIGRSITIDELFEEGFSAVFIGTGAGLPRLMHTPGEHLKHVCSANEFLVRINLMRAYEADTDTPVKVGQHVVVVGGGFTAIDAARWAGRLGAGKVTIMYRRSRKEMPAREEEVENAIAEGIDLQLLTNPVQMVGNDEGEVRALRCVRMELGEPDSSGRRRPVPIKGSEFEVPADTVITALGTTPNPIILETTEGLQGTRWGTIHLRDEETGETTLPFTYAGGDAVTGAATVILAMGAGKRAAQALDRALREKPPVPGNLERSTVLVDMCSEPYVVRSNERLACDVYEMVVQAPVVSRYCQAGQFVLAMVDASSERIPLTVADWDRGRGEITLVYQVVGKGTADLEHLRAGESLFAVSGPLGKPSEVEKFDGTVLMVAGGVGLAALYPIMRAHVEIGNDVHVVYGSRNRDLFFWLDRLHALLPEAKVSLSTDDGSSGTKGFVTDVLRQKHLGTSEAEFAVVIGPAIMMRETSKLLLANDIPTIVSLNPTMLDGSAMCGGCKVSRMNGQLGAKDFACNDGPDRPASEVDLDELVSRLATYRAEETRSLVHHIWQGLAA